VLRKLYGEKNISNCFLTSRDQNELKIFFKFYPKVLKNQKKFKVSLRASCNNSCENKNQNDNKTNASKISYPGKKGHEGNTKNTKRFKNRPNRKFETTVQHYSNKTRLVSDYGRIQLILLTSFNDMIILFKCLKTDNTMVIFIFCNNTNHTAASVFYYINLSIDRVSLFSLLKKLIPLITQDIESNPSPQKYDVVNVVSCNVRGLKSHL